MDASMKRAARGHPLGIFDILRNKRISKKRSPVERCFSVIKTVFRSGHVMVTTVENAAMKVMFKAIGYNLFLMNTPQLAAGCAAASLTKEGKVYYAELYKQVPMNDPFVSVVLCAHRTDRYQDLLDAINSLEYQSFHNYEIILVIDGNRELYKKLENFESNKKIQIILNDKNMGLSESRNRGIKRSEGNIIAFFDDDAVAEEDWIKELVRMYEEKEAIAAGGSIIPLWVTKEPRCLPQEYYWLIGATHKGFAQGSEVRNTFGSNLSFRADVLKELGGFRSEMGLKGKGQLQGEETEICERMRSRFGKGVNYNPNAVVYHKVFPERLRPIFLLKRAFWQGYSKRVMEELGYPLSEERNFLNILWSSVIERTRAVSLVAFCQMAYLLTLTFVVGLGYLFRALSSHFRTHTGP